METTLTQHPSPLTKVAFIGPESTGKTTLSALLAQHYHTLYVAEYMRTYLQRKWDEHQLTCTPDDVLPIAEGQMRTENELATQAQGFLFCDTCLLELMIYSYLYYGYCDPRIEQAALSHHYDFIFLTYIDVPWVADDLRDKPNERDEVFAFFQQMLDLHHISYIILKGDLHTRQQQVVHFLDSYQKN